MASNTHTPATGPQQPGLRAFIVCDRLPEGTIPFMLTDESMEPHLRAGDIAIIDTDDREPQHGELFLTEWGSHRRTIVEVGNFPRPECIRPRPGSRPVQQYYNCYWRGASYHLDGRLAERSRWFDGPIADWALEDRLVGKVVGILEPRFVDPARLEVA